MDNNEKIEMAEKAPVRIMSRNPVTIYDVARRAGVSQAAASVVLNGAKSTIGVSLEKRGRIKAVAAEMGYYPSAIARGLVRRKMDTIGVLFSNIEPALVTNEYAMGIMSGVMTETSPTQYNVLLFNHPPHRIDEAIPFVRDGRADGVIVVDTVMGSPVATMLASLNIPMVAVGSRFEDHGAPSVDIDTALGTRTAIEYLLGLGHTRIAHLVGDTDQKSVHIRRETFHEVLKNAGLALSGEYEIETNAEGNASYIAAQRLLTLPNRPTAIFADNDTMAVWAVSAARDMDLNVPGDISILGFDDTIWSGFVTPGLTTISQPLPAVGALATRLLIKRLAGEEIPQQTFLETPNLIVRGTTARPKDR